MNKRHLYPPADRSMPFLVLYASAFRDEIVVCHEDDPHFRHGESGRVKYAAFWTYEEAWRFAKDFASTHGLRFKGVAPFGLEDEDEDECDGVPARVPPTYRNRGPRSYLVVSDPDRPGALTVMTRDSPLGRRLPRAVNREFDDEDEAWSYARQGRNGSA